MTDYDEFEAWSTIKSRKKRKKDAKRVTVFPRLAGGIDEIPQMLGKEPLAAEDRPEEERMTRERAEALAGEILGWLEPVTDYAEVAGSYRRGRQDPGDLDVVVILKDRVRLPEIAELWLAEGKASAVNWVGEKKTQLLIDGVKVDIRTSTPRALGAALLYFTGPAGYNIGIRSAAKRAGFKLSEYGLFNRETGEYVAGATEEEIYTAMGRNYRPPTERRAENVSFAEEEEVITRSLGEIPDKELIMLYQQGKISKMQMEIGFGLKMDAESYKPPASAIASAKRGLAQRKKYGRGGLSPAEAKSQGIDSGVTRARKIASGKVSKHDVRRMSAFNRHRKNNRPSKKMPDGGPTAGTIAWNLWGGTSGVNWAKKKSAAMNAESSEEDFACTDYIIKEIKRIWYSPAQKDIKHWVEHNMAGDGLLAYHDGFDLPDGSELDEDTTTDEYFQRMFDIWLEAFEEGTWMYSDDDHGIMMQAWRVLYVPVGTPVNADSVGNWENRKQDQYGVYGDKITSWLWQSEFYAGAVFGHEGIDHMQGEEGKDFDRIVLTAWIPWEAVDWVSTIAFNISSHWQENELCVKDKETVYELNYSRNWLDEENHDGEASLDTAMNAESSECKGHGGFGRYGQAMRCRGLVEYMGYCKDCAICQRCGYSLKQDYEDMSLDEGHSHRFCHRCWEDTGRYGAETQDFADRFEIQIRTSRGNTTERIPVGRSMLVRRLREILGRQRQPYAVDVFGTESAFNVMGPYGMQVYRPTPKLLAVYKYGRFESGEMADYLNEKLGLN